MFDCLGVYHHAQGLIKPIVHHGERRVISPRWTSENRPMIDTSKTVKPVNPPYRKPSLPIGGAGLAQTHPHCETARAVEVGNWYDVVIPLCAGRLRAEGRAADKQRLQRFV
jgi:hypothetical protein